MSSRTEHRTSCMTAITEPSDALHELVWMSKEHQECFAVIALNTRLHVLGQEVIFKGTINAALVHPREIFYFAIKTLASKIIIAHNHPSGDVFPSIADRTITQRLIDAGELLGIGVLDHLILGKDGEFFSFHEDSPAMFSAAHDTGELLSGDGRA